ncbi:RagB/SusD family nutrient uptake outer membrane protein [Pedobacter heparinus]|uniref:RagB/SusD family nutrient uptake outer membrane protein n=1 Tax=Pedobacter heparinus TaxID=984 RepID=UPI002931BD42|nr:RagB/SusD family nutrient uptake outer membrane protein [Pedobacter heparinus]
MLQFTILAACLFASCKKDFLDRQPLDAEADETLIFTQPEMEAYANNFYQALPGIKNGELAGGIFWLDNPSDNLVPSNINSIPLITGTLALSNTSGWNWSGVRATNYFLQNIYKSKESPAVRLPYIGEIRFFRAMYYYDLMRRFGDLPWYNRVLEANDAGLQAPRVSRSVICDSILADLDFAITNLKPKLSAAPQRLNRDVAIAFKARIALYEGTWEKYHKGSAFGGSKTDEGIADYLRQARDAAKALIDGGNYTIHSTNTVEWDYINLFNQKDLSTNKEIILWKKFDASLQVGHSAMRYRAGGTGLSKNLVESYLDIDGKPIAVSSKYAGDRTLEDVVKNRDPRLRHMIWLPGEAVEFNSAGVNVYPFYFNWMPSGDAAKNPTGYQLFKGQIRDQLEGTLLGTGTRAEILFRFAETMLIYAEARAELNELNQADIDLTINKLRKRAGMPNLLISTIITDPNWQFPGLSPIMNEIRRERRVELAAEGFRPDDLYRWRAHHLLKGYRAKGVWAALLPKSGGKNPYTGGAAPTITLGTNVLVGADGYVEPFIKSLPNGFLFNEKRDYLYPIPIEELTLNTNLKQNPEW